jgi:hypothetical protein
LIRKISQTALLALGLVLASQPSMAVTISFEGPDVEPYVEGDFKIVDARIVDGNCASGNCLALNSNETSRLSKVDGGTFTLTSFSFWFEFLGNHGILTVTPFVGSSAGSPLTLTEADFPHNHGQTSAPTGFTNITSILFDGGSVGNIRIDDINVTSNDNAPPPGTPLPGAVWLLGTVLAGGAGMNRWRKRRQARMVAA